MRFERDEHGQYLCPLDERVLWDDGEEIVTKGRPCRTPLYLNLCGSIPIGVTEPHGYSYSYEFSSAVTSAWTVECENGHVLLRSAGEETAEPFELRHLLGDQP